MFSAIWQWIKEIINNMIGGKTIEQTLKVAPVLSSEMEHAIQLWSDMYKNEAPWLHEPSFNDPTRVVSLGLPSLIASEKARMVLIEMESEITTPTKQVEVENPNYKEPEPDEFGNVLPSAEPKTIVEEKPTSNTARGEFLNAEYTKLKAQLRKQLEYGIAKGGLVIKPYIVTNKTDDDAQTTSTFEFDFIQADCFYPLSFDASGHITEAAFVQTKTEKDVIYRRLEYHKWMGNQVQVINRAFKSTNTQDRDGGQTGIDLGKEVPLTEIPEWKDIEPKVIIKNINKPLFAYFKMPEANTIDTNSPLGVSGYSRAVSLIKDADMQYSRMLWEYEAGEMAIDIDRDALNFIEGGVDRDGKRMDGHSVLGKMQQRLYRKVDLGESNTYEPYAPSLRDSQYIQGLNVILMRIEDAVGLSRGTLSDAAAEARTATELKILKQRSFSVNLEIQKALEYALKDVVYIMNTYCSLYQLTPEGEYDISFEWDDSILVDAETELTKRITLMQNGLASKLEVRQWYFGETERQAREALQKINEESLESAEQDIMLNSNYGGNNNEQR